MFVIHSCYSARFFDGLSAYYREKFYKSLGEITPYLEAVFLCKKLQKNTWSQGLYTYKSLSTQTRKKICVWFSSIDLLTTPCCDGWFERLYTCTQKHFVLVSRYTLRQVHLPQSVYKFWSMCFEMYHFRERAHETLNVGKRIILFISRSEIYCANGSFVVG